MTILSSFSGDSAAQNRIVIEKKQRLKLASKVTGTGPALGCSVNCLGIPIDDPAQGYFQIFRDRRRSVRRQLVRGNAKTCPG
jgi:hypothetical protein